MPRSQVNDAAAVGGELVFGEAGECVVELAQQAGTVFGQAPEQRHGVRHGVAHQGGGNGEGGDECAEFFEPLPLSGFDEPPSGDVGGQRSFGKERQRDDAYYIRMQAVEKRRRCIGRPQSVSGARQPRHVGEIVFDARLVEPPALRHGFGRRVPLVHELQRRFIARFGADRQSRDAAGAEFPQFLVAFCFDVRYSGEHADGLHLGQVVTDGIGQPDKPVVAEHKRVGADQEDAPGARLTACDAPQVGLDFLRGRKAETQVAVERTEFAGVVRAADRRLQQDGVGFVGRTPDGAREMLLFRFGHNFCNFVGCKIGRFGVRNKNAPAYQLLTRRIVSLNPKRLHG